MSEEWKAIPGSETYEVSSLGRVRNRKRLCKITSRQDGYCVCSIKGKTRYVHHLVANAFLYGEGEVDHIDGNKSNNSVGNLQRVTHSENVRKTFSLFRASPTGRSKTVIGYTKDSLTVYPSVREAARRVGRSQSAISFALKYGYQSAGARWFYAE